MDYVEGTQKAELLQEIIIIMNNRYLYCNVEPCT